MLWILELAQDVESDLHRFHGIEVDIEEERFPRSLPAKRLFEYIERLPAYDGVIAARILAIREQERESNPSRAALARPDTTVKDFVYNPGVAHLVEYERV